MVMYSIFDRHTRRFFRRTYLGSSVIEVWVELVDHKSVLFDCVQTDVEGFDSSLVQEIQETNDI